MLLWGRIFVCEASVPQQEGVCAALCAPSHPPLLLNIPQLNSAEWAAAWQAAAHTPATLGTPLALGDGGWPASRQAAAQTSSSAGRRGSRDPHSRTSRLLPRTHPPPPPLPASPAYSSPTPPLLPPPTPPHSSAYSPPTTPTTPAYPPALTYTPPSVIPSSAHPLPSSSSSSPIPWGIVFWRREWRVSFCSSRVLGQLRGMSSMPYTACSHGRPPSKRGDPRRG